jgi:tRNA pseudouridine38-40 synthase
MRRNIKMVLQYDGGRYNGWQAQRPGDVKTIQGKLARVLTQMVARGPGEGAVCGEDAGAGWKDAGRKDAGKKDAGKKDAGRKDAGRKEAGKNAVGQMGADDLVEVIGSGRTDAGVHARGQVANALLDTDMSPDQIKSYLNRYLPSDIAVTEVEEAPPRFHSRFGALRKVYAYTIQTGEKKDVFDRKYQYCLGRPLDTAAMQKAALALCGTHDFRNFCTKSAGKKGAADPVGESRGAYPQGVAPSVTSITASGSDAGVGGARSAGRLREKSTVRTLYRISVTRKGSLVVIEYEGDGFLPHMVRIITGTLIEVGLGRRQADSMGELLETGKRSDAGFQAPAEGLCLMKVIYG